MLYQQSNLTLGGLKRHRIILLHIVTNQLIKNEIHYSIKELQINRALSIDNYES